MGELIGYARCSTVLQDLTVQRQALAALGRPGRLDLPRKGLTGTQPRPLPADLPRRGRLVRPMLMALSGHEHLRTLGIYVNPSADAVENDRELTDKDNVVVVNG